MSIQTISRFGNQETKLLFALETRDTNLITFDETRQILGSSIASVKNVIKRLKKKNRIITLQKGVYLFAPLRSGEDGAWSEDSFKVVPTLVDTPEYYIGFISAMNHWGMTEQIPYVVYVALLRQKHRLEAVQTRFIFVKKRKLGDLIKIQLGNTTVNISSIEQTILDGLTFPEYCLGTAGIAKAIWFKRKEIDWNKLIGLAKNDKDVVRRRLGYLLQELGLKKQAKELKTDFKGFAWLDQSRQKTTFNYVKEWGLKVNVPESQLLEFMEGH